MRQDLINNKNNKIGEINKNKYGSTMQIVDYENANNITILFPEHKCTVKNRKYSYFKKGEINSPMDKTIFDVGCIGNERGNNKDWRYIIWHSMMDRCYNPRSLKRNPTYKGCFVCEEWHNLQNFIRWCDENYYEIENGNVSLDKDILIKGNKVYSSETSIFVPQDINTLIIKTDKTRGVCPIGVSICKNGKFRAYCNGANGKQIHLGHYDSDLEAFNAYKSYKETVIKQKADIYKDKIPVKLYKALYNFTVELSD